MLVYKGKTIPSISIGNRTITEIYKGQTRLYRLGFDPITFTDNATWTVPPGVKQIKVDCVAGQGFSNAADAGGKGGRVQCILNVTPGTTLKIKVGLQNTVFNVSNNASAIYTGDIWTSDYLIIAGGGGGACYTNYLAIRHFAGGVGGGLTGGTGGNFGGQNARADIGIAGLGGSQTAGGARGYFAMYLKSLYAKAGSKFAGGAPAAERSLSGAGGQGFFGGGGAVEGYYYKGSSEHGASCAAAGGGSSYTHSNLCTNVVHTQGYQSGNGYVTLSMV